MKFIANVIWFLFGGLASFLLYTILGLALCLTIIGIPFGLQCFKIGQLMLAPFGKEVVYGGKGGSFFLNMIWLILFGWELALFSFLLGIVYCITIIGIPAGIQVLKLAKLVLMPFGTEIRKKSKVVKKSPTSAPADESAQAAPVAEPSSSIPQQDTNETTEVPVSHAKSSYRDIPDAITVESFSVSTPSQSPQSQLVASQHTPVQLNQVQSVSPQPIAPQPIAQSQPTAPVPIATPGPISTRQSSFTPNPLSAKQASPVPHITSVGQTTPLQPTSTKQQPESPQPAPTEQSEIPQAAPTKQLASPQSVAKRKTSSRPMIISIVVVLVVLLGVGGFLVWQFIGATTMMSKDGPGNLPSLTVPSLSVPTTQMIGDICSNYGGELQLVSETLFSQDSPYTMSSYTCALYFGTEQFGSIMVTLANEDFATILAEETASQTSQYQNATLRDFVELILAPQVMAGQIAYEAVVDTPDYYRAIITPNDVVSSNFLNDTVEAAGYKNILVQVDADLDTAEEILDSLNLYR